MKNNFLNKELKYKYFFASDVYKIIGITRSEYIDFFRVRSNQGPFFKPLLHQTSNKVFLLNFTDLIFLSILLLLKRNRMDRSIIRYLSEKFGDSIDTSGSMLPDDTYMLEMWLYTSGDQKCFLIHSRNGRVIFQSEVLFFKYSGHKNPIRRISIDEFNKIEKGKNLNPTAIYKIDLSLIIKRLQNKIKELGL